MFFNPSRLFPAPGAMKIESGMVFFTFWLSETYRGWYLTYFMSFFQISMFPVFLGVFLYPKFRRFGPPGIFDTGKSFSSLTPANLPLL